MNAPAPSRPRPRSAAPLLERGAGQRVTLRAQFTLVISLLAFLPNLVLTLLSPAPLTWAALVWMVLVALLCGATGYLLSAALLRPLQRLEREVQAKAFAQLHPDDPREIVCLRAAFVGLTNRLEAEQGRRAAFMATLVHDLKTPLIATGHLTQTLASAALPEAERREIGGHIRGETERLLGLVQQMADAHRFERDEVQLQLAPADLGELIGRVARRHAPQAEERGLALSTSGGGRATVDAAALERALSNLTENALRYAQNRVHLHVSAQGCSVQDDGPGLPPGTSVHDLAQPFNAQPTTIAGHRYTAGTAGLGLFIVRRIAEAHGGELRYAEEASLSPASAGAPHPTFTITLPEVLP